MQWYGYGDLQSWDNQRGKLGDCPPCAATGFGQLGYEYGVGDLGHGGPEPGKQYSDDHRCSGDTGAFDFAVDPRGPWRIGHLPDETQTGALGLAPEAQDFLGEAEGAEG